MPKTINYDAKDIEAAVFVAEQLCYWTKQSPEIIKEYMYGDNHEFVGHVFFGDMLNVPLFDLLQNDGDEEKISKYIQAIILMFNINNPYIMNILDVTIFEYLSDSKKVWNKLGEYLPADIIK